MKQRPPWENEEVIKSGKLSREPVPTCSNTRENVPGNQQLTVNNEVKLRHKYSAYIKSVTLALGVHFLYYSTFTNIFLTFKFNIKRPDKKRRRSSRTESAPPPGSCCRGPQVVPPPGCLCMGPKVVPPPGCLCMVPRTTVSPSFSHSSVANVWKNLFQSEVHGIPD